MMKLRHMTLFMLDHIPDGIRDDMKWEVEQEVTELKHKRRNLENSMDFVINQRKKYFYPIPKNIQKKINKTENEISTFLFDTWRPSNEAEEIWREYFFCLYEFTYIERSGFSIDMSNVRSLHDYNTEIFEKLDRPKYPMSEWVHLLDFKYRELYLLYKDLKYPDPVEKANECLSKKILLSKEYLKLKNDYGNIVNLIDSYEDLLSSSLWS